MVDETTVHNDIGDEVDARFSVEFSGGQKSVVFASAGGTTAGGNARNKQYNQGLELVLARLASCGARLEAAFVESKATQNLSSDDRMLRLPGWEYPVELTSVSDFTAFRLELCRMQRTTGSATTSSGSGNNQRRIRLVVDLPETGAYSEDVLKHVLAHGSSDRSAMIDLQFVTSRAQVVRSLVNFNWTARQNVERTSKLLTATEYWVFESGTEQFAPSKFAGFQNMTIGIYDQANQLNLPIFNGHRTRLAIEAAVGTEFLEDPELGSHLVHWADNLLEPGVVSSVDQSKWRFLNLGPSRSSVSYREFGKAPPDDPHELQMFARRVRRGQPAFRDALLELYEGECAVTGHGPESVVEACHIAPHAETGINDIGNGILLRADIHHLFDDGLLKIEPVTCRVVFDESLQDSPYWRFHGTRLRPRRDGGQPSDKYLEMRWNGK